MPVTKKTLYSVYLATFFYSLHYAITLYLESTYMAHFVPAQTVGLLFTIAALISIVIHFNISPILRRVGNYTFILWLVVFEVFALFTLATSELKELIIVAFIFHQTLINLIFLSLTVFSEAFSKDETTGGTRGIFLTVVNLAILCGPLIASQATGDFFFRDVFLWSAMLVLPILFFVGKNLRGFRDPNYNKITFVDTLRRIITEKSLHLILSIQFLLEFFYGTMVIYLTVYLFKVVGIEIKDILGIIYPVMLLPFVIFPYISGVLADKKFGEKEMLFVGFLMISIFTLFLSFITSKEIIVWATALFMTRIGATLVETMTESYFFKHVDATDAEVIGFFRNLRPLSYVMVPIVASVFLSIFPLQYIFAGLAIVMLLGLRYTYLLKDTK